MSLSVKLENEQQLLDAIKKVRLDSDPTDWAVVGHFQDDPNKIELVASGTNGYDGMINTLQEDKVMYAILRVSTTVDLSITIKFVYIHLIGRKVGFANRGKFSVVHGSVKKLFMPFHVEFEVEGLDEVPLKDITEKVEKAAGNADFVRSGAFAGTRPEYGKHMNQKEIDNQKKEKDVKPLGQPNVGNKAVGAKPVVVNKSEKVVVPSAVTQSQTQSIDPALQESLKFLRSNQKEVMWVAATFPDQNINKPLQLLEKGSGGVDNFVKLLQADKIIYVYVKVIDMIDGNETIKFVLVNFIGSNIGGLKKAKLVTLKGAVNQVFSPFHVVFMIN